MKGISVKHRLPSEKSKGHKLMGLCPLNFYLFTS
jgi:hypothetical protein